MIKKTEPQITDVNQQNRENFVLLEQLIRLIKQQLFFLHTFVTFKSKKI